MTTIPDDARLGVLAESAGVLLRENRVELTAAESCTGGWVAKVVTDVPGSSAWFWGSVVTYSNAAKQRLLGVSAATLARHGAVSRACAHEMVGGALAHSDADVAIAVTGIAGPDGGTPDKPVGTVWIAWQRRGGDARAELFRFDGDRDAVRRQTVAVALDGIGKILTP